MKTVKKILSSVLYGVLGCALSICIAPFVAVAVVCYMTKVSFELGYMDDPEQVAKEIEKNIEEKEKLTEHEI